MVHDNTYMEVLTVSPVDSVTLYEANKQLEFNANNSHLRVEDNSSKRFEVDKRPALVTDSVSEKNDSSKFGKLIATTFDFERQADNDHNFLQLE